MLKIHSLWLASFIQDFRTFMDTASAQLTQYPSIQSAMAILVAGFRQSAQDVVLQSDDSFSKHEFSSIACILFICVLAQSVSQPSAPAPVSCDSLFCGASENAHSLFTVEALLAGSSSKMQAAESEALFNTLFHGVDYLPDKSRKMEYAFKLTSILSRTSNEARRGVSKCLLHIMYPKQANQDMVYCGDN